MLDRTTAIQNSKICEECGNGFDARQHGGGKPQRFCSSTCRLNFHAKARKAESREGSGDMDAQRANVRPTCSRAVVVYEPPASAKPDAKPAAKSEFDWNDSESVILKRQPATAVYWNAAGDLVIRQQCWPEDDPVIVIAESNAQAFLDKLCDAMGIGGYCPP